MCTTHHLQKNYVHNLSLEKNYTHKLYFKQLCIQVVRISFAHIKLILKNFLPKFYISKLCIKVVYISYDFSEMKTCQKKNKMNVWKWEWTGR
jgi:hypothetical protein